MDIVRSFDDVGVLPVGLIDWLTLRLDIHHLSREVLDRLRNKSGSIVRLSELSPIERDWLQTNTVVFSRTGQEFSIDWQTNARQSIRSDSHALNIHLGTHLELSGSPARMFSENNMFGSLDIQYCSLSMIKFVCKELKIFLPRDLKIWSCTRIDITQNFDLGSRSVVQDALQNLKHGEIANRKVTFYGSTVQWGGRKGSPSRLHGGKAYAKGDHARFLMRKGKSSFTDEQLLKADQVLRFEYMLRGTYIKRLFDQSGMRWYDFTPSFLISLHNEYFKKVVSDLEVTDMDTILQLLMAETSPGRARSAYQCYLNIKSQGFTFARENYSNRKTFSNHLTLLRRIGLSDADFQASNITPLRRKPINLELPVASWDDIKLSGVK